MTMLCIGMIVGVVLGFVFFGIGLISKNDNIKTEKEKIDSETAIIALQNLRISLCRTEQEAIDYAIECINKCNKIEEWINNNIDNK